MIKPLTAAIDNVLASKLGDIAADAGNPDRPGVGDLIDRGLILLRLLEEKGFRVYRPDEQREAGDRKPHEGESIESVLKRWEGEVALCDQPMPGFPQTSAHMRTIASVFREMITEIRAAMVALKPEAGVWWCNSHQRPAAGQNGCAQGLAGSLAICRVVFAPIEIVEPEQPEHIVKSLRMLHEIRAAVVATGITEDEGSTLGMVISICDYAKSRSMGPHPQTILDVLREHDKMRRALIGLGHAAVHGIPDRVTGQPAEPAHSPEHVGPVKVDGWRDITDPQMRLKAGDMAREANDDTWIDIHPSWVDTRIGDHQRVHFRRHEQMGLTDTEIVNRLSRHFVTVTHKHDPAGHRQSMYFIQRGTLRERAIELPQ